MIAKAIHDVLACTHKLPVQRADVPARVAWTDMRAWMRDAHVQCARLHGGQYVWQCVRNM